MKNILDIGCGTGSSYLKGLNGQYKVGIDVWLPCLKNASMFDDVVLCDLRFGVPFKDCSFDAVICQEVIEHLPRKAGLSLIEEIKRVSKKVIWIKTPAHFRHWGGEKEENLYQKHRSSYTKKDFKGLKVRGDNWSYSIHPLIRLLLPRIIPVFFPALAEHIIARRP